MGGIFQITCDGALFNRCLDCFLGKAAYISDLQDNLVDLENELGRLMAAKDDVMTRVVNAERQQMRRLGQVEWWVSRVDAVKTVADELMRHRSQEIDKLCVGGYCSKNYMSSYKFGKQVAKKLQDVKTLIAEGVFAAVATEVVPERAPEPEGVFEAVATEVVPERAPEPEGVFEAVATEVLPGRAPEPVADKRPTEQTVVGLQSQLEQVWKCLLVEESAGIIGLYGMGGVGKTTLLTHINNKFSESPANFDCVIWVVVSKDLRLEKIQDDIGKNIGLSDDSWKNKSFEDKAVDILRSLGEKRFVLLLDDLWEPVDLTKLGVPLPNAQNTTSKVVFTTRSIDVCGSMRARPVEVACLSEKDAWKLFRENVGEETLQSHHEIVELAQTVAKECGGLPLALLTIGRAMAYRKKADQWRRAIEALRRSASEFAGLGKDVYPLLKFSYDSLQNDTVRSCFLYCCLYPEDYVILKWDLIDCWIGEGFFGESDRSGAENRGNDILDTLVRACLLEEVEDDEVKMHDVVRDMAIWIACEIEKEKRNFLVCAGAGQKEAPDVKRWENVRRLSLMQNQIETLSEVPKCPHLLTLFLDFNKELEMIADGFFQFMPSLKVLKMSNCVNLNLKLPVGMSELGSSLELLDISRTKIRELPEELKKLVNLKCLNLRWTYRLNKIPRQLISNSSRLRVLRMFATGYGCFQAAPEDNVLFGGGEVLIAELLGLKDLEVLELTLGSYHALQTLLSSNKLKSCIRSLFLQLFRDTTSIIDATAFAYLNNLNELYINRGSELEELKIDYTKIVRKRREPFVFDSLRHVTIWRCAKLKDSTFLVFAPNLKSLVLRNCLAMEEIISVGKFSKVPQWMGHMSPFDNLQRLRVEDLPDLKSIHWEPLPFTHLKEMGVRACDQLVKLPLDSSIAKERKFVIRGEEDWWNRLQWEDKATQIAFRSCFQPYS